MAPPSQLVIATSVLNRLVREKSSYHKELEQQQAGIEKLEQNQGDDENAEYQLRQERKAVEETKAIFPQLRQRIHEAREKLEQELEQNKATGEGQSPDEINKANEAIAASLAAERETY